MQDFEKLGVFYLGRQYDLGAKKLTDDLVLYDSKNLVTHAVVVGMTGSGKTGLCIDMIEEAAIDGIPSILIDPKGDLANLLLTFPGLAGSDFQPWVNEDDASKKGLSVPDYAVQQADLWKKGLADWGESGDRIQRLRNAADFLIYTPGSSAGIPVSIVKSFAAPPPEIMEDAELLQGRITTTVSSLLGLAGIDADPLQSREHILLSTIVGQSWKQGQDLDLASLIQQTQNPPVSRIGVLDVESFYPSKERFALVLALNNLLASPSFGAWMAGVPLDIAEILHTPQGKPRVAIFSIAHLGDSERMFFVSLLLNQVLGWMRTQSGTSSLRALLYMDEIFGFFPPVQNPPSKQPFLTLLKQARAFGLGVILATQNPVDLDYKGLSNAGAWFVGRLQTERDKARLMDGLEGAAASTGGSFDRNKMEQIIAGLGNRVFLMNDSHLDAPVVFQTRWCLSYLRGPLTRDQIKRLMDPVRGQVGQISAAAPSGKPAPAAQAAAAVAPRAAQPPATAPGPAATAGLQPTLPPDVPQYFVPARGRAAAGQSLLYQPMLVGAAKVRFLDAKSKADVTQNAVYVTAITDAAVPVNWEEGQEASFALEDLEKSAGRGGQFAELPLEAGKAKNYPAWGRDFSAWLYGAQKLELMRSPSTGQVSNPGESERDFRVRLQQSFREQRDKLVEALRQKYAPKINTAEDRVRRAQGAVDREAGQAHQVEMQTAISVGSTLLGALLGGRSTRSTFGRATTAARGASRSMQQMGDVGRAKEDLKAYQQQLADLQTQFSQETAELQSRVDPQSETFETVVIRPKKTDITVQLTALLWAPFWQDARGGTTQAW
jgi:DNA helicase HerA-like ATPase